MDMEMESIATQFTGALPLPRVLQEHPFWTENRTFSRAEAFIDLMYRARYSKIPEKIIDRGEILVINEGQVLTSILSLSKKMEMVSGKS